MAFNREKRFVLVTYSTRHLEKKDKVRFFYAIKGRYGSQGVIRLYNIEQLAKTVFLVPINNINDVKSFLEFWKCSYKTREVSINE